MKPQKLVLCAIVLMLGLANLQAGEAREFTSAKKQLKDEIKFLFNYVPFETFLQESECCVLDVTFRVNDNRELEDIYVEGNNKDLVDYANRVLKRNTIKAHSLLEGITFKVSIRFAHKS